MIAPSVCARKLKRTVMHNPWYSGYLHVVTTSPRRFGSGR